MSLSKPLPAAELSVGPRSEAAHRHESDANISRFDKLRQSPNRKDLLSGSLRKELPPQHHEIISMEIPAESIALSQSQESQLKDETFARGGFINHLSADYDLQSASHLPPLQARFEASFIYMPDEELVQKIMLELEREYPHLHIHEQKRQEPQSSTKVILKQGAYVDERYQAPSLRPQPRPQAHLLPQQPEYFHRPVAPSRNADEPAYNHHTDYYHLAADYDVHRRSHLPPLQARFESSFIYMPDEELAKRLVLELQHEYSHLRPSIVGDEKVDEHHKSRCGFLRFW